jgi:glycosyltransferase involved in cell wall biosynthesis
VQEVEWLGARFGGEVLYLRPAWRARARYPRPLLGLHRAAAVRALDRRVDRHHVYAPELYWLPLLWLVRRPVVYTVTAGVGAGPRMPPVAFLRRLGAIVVPGPGDLDALRRLGLRNGHLIRPGIDVARFAGTPPPPGPPFVLMSGSAPWTREQFRAKGVDALLEAARGIPDLRLLFLWRGVLLSELVARVRQLGLDDRVEILSERADVARVMARVHAGVVLAERPGLVKAYPHSLLEALAAGRPVVVSDGSPMADYVRETGCGRVVPELSAPGLIEAIRRLREDYDGCRMRARAVATRDFALEEFVSAHQRLYQAL